MIRLKVFSNPCAAAYAGAELIAATALKAIRDRGTAFVAVSGGRTPWLMFQDLAKRELPWREILFFQADERDCAIGDDQRNLTHLRAALPLQARIEPMPVEAGVGGASVYADRLVELIGHPPIFDLVHLGLGKDGHTASLVPNDPLLEERRHDVAWSSDSYQGHRRMTLTYPALNRARLVFWLVTGADKRSAMEGLLAGDATLPAARVSTEQRILIADNEAAGTN